MFSYFHHVQCSLSDFHSQTALLVSMGDRSTHVIPIVKGNVMYGEIKRINVGGNHGFESMYKSLNLRYPHLKRYLNYQFVEQLSQNYTQVATDYSEQLGYFQKGIEKFQNTAYRNEIEYENNKLVLQEEEKQHFVFFFRNVSCSQF